MVSHEHKIIIRHLRKSRDIAKLVLKTVPETGSALINHKFELTTRVSADIEMISEIDFLPIIRLYKTGQSKIVDDENLLNEDIEDVPH